MYGLDQAGNTISANAVAVGAANIRSMEEEIQTYFPICQEGAAKGTEEEATDEEGAAVGAARNNPYPQPEFYTTSYWQFILFIHLHYT